MRKEIIKKTFGSKTYWLRMTLDGEDEDSFLQVAKTFYSNTQEGDRIFLACCLNGKYISENLNEKCNSNLYVKMNFGSCNKNDFENEMKHFDEEEINFEKFVNDEYSKKFEINDEVNNKTIRFINAGKRSNRLFDIIKQKSMHDPFFREQLFNNIREGKCPITDVMFKKC